jgi:hypothetical protein
MLNDATKAERFRRNALPQALSGILHSQGREAETASTASSCAAFGYLEGVREQATALEFRFRDGNGIWFSYHWLGTWRFNPSEGLLLKYSGDLIYLVLIRGTNLDQPLKAGVISLTQGFHEHRVVWVREMSEEETEQVGEAGPTIDRIEVGQFDSQDAIKEWLDKMAPPFAD